MTKNEYDIVSPLRDSIEKSNKKDVIICARIDPSTFESAIPAIEVFLHPSSSPIEEGSYEIKENETLIDVVDKHLAEEVSKIQKANLEKKSKDWNSFMETALLFGDDYDGGH